jgi:hypothetical protein
MATIGDILADAREREGVAFDAPGRTTGYAVRDFCTGAWKAGNLLRHYGVRGEATVAVVVGSKDPESAEEPGSLGAAADPLLALLGATLLGATVDLDPGPTVEATALVAPAAWLDRYDAQPGCTQLAYGGPPAEPSVVHFERERWSENPVAPPDHVTSDAVAMVEGQTHADLLGRAQEVVSGVGLGAGDQVATRGHLTAESVAPGVLAPMVAGATIIGGDWEEADAVVDPDGTVTAG